MSIRLRIFLSFFGILALFALNIFIYRAGNAQRAESFEAVRRALDRQALVLDLEQSLAARRGEVEDYRVVAELDLERPEPVEVRIDRIEALQPAVKQLGELAEDASRASVDRFAQLFEQVRAEWIEFYRSLDAESEDGDEIPGEDPAVDSASLDAEEAPEDGEPAEEETDFVALAFEQLQTLKVTEAQQVETATTDFNQVAADTDRKTLLIFLVSALVALGVGALFSAHINRGLAALSAGARRIGEGDLEHRIALRRRDELGELAESFNKMSENLKTARARVEEARAAAEEANQAKSTFLANMSHELRTPMNAIIGYTEMLSEDAEDLGQQELLPDLQKILAAGKHLMALINDVLDLSKIEAGKMTLFLEDFEVSNLVDDVVATIQPLVKKNRNRLVVEVSPDVGSHRADETKVRQTLFNLLSNACKFTEDGTVTLTVKRSHRGPAEWMVFQVADTGIGMSSEQMGKVFDEFTQADASTTRKFGGTGLGLTISRKFCQLMGGDIHVNSAQGSGTVFTVELPAVVRSDTEDPVEARTPSRSVPALAEEVPTRRPAVGPEPPVQEPPPGGTVLVIDDEEAALDLTRRFLSREGFTVMTAAEGMKGLELARAVGPDVIILDIMMPGMDGWAVLNELKHDPTTADIPVMMMSMIDEKEMGFALGASEYMVKPVDRRRLKSYLERYLDSSHAGSGRVLIVEDEPDTRELIRRGLEKDGWAIDEAANGREALEQLEGPKPDLILLDLMMPEMDGFTFLDHLRATDFGQAIPVVVVSAQAVSPDQLERLDGKVEAVLRKGERENLLQALRDQVRTSVAQRTDPPRNNSTDGQDPAG